MAVVAVYRSPLLPASETFIRNQGLALTRHRALFSGWHRVDGLALPAEQVVVAEPGGRARRALRRRLPGDDGRARLVAACRAREVRLVHAHFGFEALPALDLARALDVPLAVTFHGFDATLTDEAMRSAGGGLAEWVKRRGEVFAHASLLLAVSTFIAHEVRRQGGRVDRLRVHRIGVPVSPLLEPLPREPVVLFVGRHVEKKGLGDLVEAMAAVRAAVPGAQLRVVGDGPLRAPLEARAREVLSEAEFLGWLDPDGVREQMRRVRVLCVPSRRAANGDAEGLGQVVLEAAAVGLPVVATRHGGLPEAVSEGESGLLADEGDVEGLAGQLVALLRDEALWARLSAGARRHVARSYDLRRQTRELEDLYDGLLA